MTLDSFETAAVRLPGVTVVIALHHPSPAAAARQLASLGCQKNVALSIVAVLDGAETAADGGLRPLLERHGCSVVVLQERQGVRRAFAAGLAAALKEHPAAGQLFAFCDQDDVWHPDKLEKTCEALVSRGAALVHCDAAVTGEEGQVLASSLHGYESRREPDGLPGMLLLNTVTGMTAVFTRETAELAVKLCEGFGGKLLHDHLTAIAAASLGSVAFVKEPLVDYIQHKGNQLGARPHVAWRSRALGLAHAAAYRRTSAEMFCERRGAALLLAGEGRLPRNLEAMYLTARRTNVLALMAGHCAAVFRFLLKGDGRRAMLSLRMCDAAISYLVRGGSRAVPPAGSQPEGQ